MSWGHVMVTVCVTIAWVYLFLLVNGWNLRIHSSIGTHFSMTESQRWKLANLKPSKRTGKRYRESSCNAKAQTLLRCEDSGQMRFPGVFAALEDKHRDNGSGFMHWKYSRYPRGQMEQVVQGFWISKQVQLWHTRRVGRLDVLREASHGISRAPNSSSCFKKITDNI